MTPDMLDLARRAVACRGWRWMLGMQAITPDGLFGHRVTEHTILIDPDHLPDLTDPATLGCLLALVRKARGEPTYLPTCLDVHDEAWVVNPPISRRQTRYEGYASVLLAALEAAA
jgi:hypothetical protein